MLVYSASTEEGGNLRYCTPAIRHMGLVCTHHDECGPQEISSQPRKLRMQVIFIVLRRVPTAVRPNVGGVSPGVASWVRHHRSHLMYKA